VEHVKKEMSERYMLKQGIVQLYTGNTGQMNYAHIGLCLRATGQKLRTFIMGFFPHPLVDIEDRALSYLRPFVEVERLSLHYGYKDETIHDADAERIRAAIEHVQEIVESGTFDIIILEDINQMVDRGIIPAGRILDLLERKPPHVELVLTGSSAKEEIIAQSELVTEMVVHKGEEESWLVGGANREGCVWVVTGDGKGKTTYCLGVAIFFAASGIPSSVIQFIKSPRAYGEAVAIERFPNIEVKTMGEGFIVGPSRPSQKHMKAARKAWEACIREIFSLTYPLIVLDEVNVATHLGLIHPERVREMMFLKPKGVNIILSGRNAHPEIIEHASAVFEMREIKHPFRKGIQARMGIEF
jgi:cob(I)alamin adenosyltransferase